MKINLGEKGLEVMPPTNDSLWFPRITFPIKGKRSWPIGESIEAEVTLVVKGVSVGSDGKTLKCEVELRTMELEDPMSKMEKAGY